MIRGPCTQPRLIASRSASVTPLSSPRLRTVVKPARSVFIPFICASKACSGVIVANIGEQSLLAAAIGRQVDMAVDQAGQDRFVLEVDDRDAGLRRRDMAVMDRYDAALVDHDGRRAAHGLPRHRDQPSGMNIGRRRSRARSRQRGDRRPRPKLKQCPDLPDGIARQLKVRASGAIARICRSSKDLRTQVQ